MRITFTPENSSAGLIVRCLQSALKEFVEEEGLWSSLQSFQYISIDALRYALEPDASPLKIFHAFMCVALYCNEHEDDFDELVDMFGSHLEESICEEGRRIMKIEKDKKDRRMNLLK